MVVNKSIRGMQETLNLLDHQDFEEAIQKIVSARRVSIYGIGTSSSVALDFVSRLIRIGIPASYYSDIHLQQLAVLSYTEIEGMNNETKLLKRTGYVYQRFDHLRTRILLISRLVCNQFDPRLITFSEE